jgi:hypothetical protein
MATAFEVGDKVKIELDGTYHAGTIITYQDDKYQVSIEGLGKLDYFSSSDMELISSSGSSDSGSSGGGGVALIVNGSDDAEVIVLDKTWEEIKDAFIAGTSVLIHYADTEWADNQYVLVNGIANNSGQYYVYLNSAVCGVDSFTASSEDSYPEYAW